MIKLRLALVMMLSFVCFDSIMADELTKNEIDRIEKQVKEMTKVMSLSNDQAAKLETLKTVLTKKNIEAKKKYGVKSEEWKAAKKTNLRNYSVALRKVCSNDQLKLWQDYNKENN